MESINRFRGVWHIDIESFYSWTKKIIPFICLLFLIKKILILQTSLAHFLLDLFLSTLFFYCYYKCLAFKNCFVSCWHKNRNLSFPLSALLNSIIISNSIVWGFQLDKHIIWKYQFCFLFSPYSYISSCLCCLTILARISSTVLNGSLNGVRVCLVPNFKNNASNISY